MSRGKKNKQIVVKGAKQSIEEYFATAFPTSDLWNTVGQIASSMQEYDTWHAQQTTALGDFLAQQNCLGNMQNDRRAVAAKLLNTFMHQLTKYDRFRPLWPHLHLPLDGRVFDSFAQVQATRPSSLAIRKINQRIGTNTAYSISHTDYQFIQNTLWGFIHELDQRQGVQFQIISRIELNYLWL